MFSINEMFWPAAIALAWVVGELSFRWISLPRISSYGITGFAMAASQGEILGDPSGQVVAQMANVAFALILFELGYRINLRWLRHNYWLGVTSLVESIGTFAAVFFVANAFSMSLTSSLMLAALAMSTSPAAVLRVANDTRSTGQITERLLHLTAFNTVLTVFVFKIVLGYWMLESAVSIPQAAWHSVMVLFISASVGVLFGVVVPGLLRLIDNRGRNSTVAFAITVILLTSLTHILGFSSLIAALAFGLVARHRRVVLTQTQRNFGALGDVLTVVLFVFVAASLDWKHVSDGLGIALAVIVCRFLIKTASAALFARPSGIGWRKGALTGLAMMPMSAFVMLLLEQTKYLELDVMNQVAGLAAIVLLLEIIGPVMTQRALMLAGEANQKEGD